MYIIKHNITSMVENTFFEVLTFKLLHPICSLYVIDQPTRKKSPGVPAKYTVCTTPHALNFKCFDSLNYLPNSTNLNIKMKTKT